MKSAEEAHGFSSSTSVTFGLGKNKESVLVCQNVVFSVSYIRRSVATF